MRTFQASKNDNNDLLVIVDETVCVGVPVEVHTKTKGREDSFDKEWFDNWLVPRIEASECPRMDAPIGPLAKGDQEELRELTSEALKPK